jgi:DNA replication protein DnaC
LVKERVMSSRARMVSHCKLCGGSGFTDSNGFKRRVYCRCMKQFLIEKNLLISGVPLEALELLLKIRKGKSLVDVEYKQVYLDVNEHNIHEVNRRKMLYKDLLMPYIKNSDIAVTRGDSLLMFGSNSRGKTWSLYYIALNLMDKFSVLFMPLKDLFIHINNAYYGADNSREAAIYKQQAQAMLSLIRDVDILLLDEGSKLPKFSDSVSVQLEGIAKERIGNNKVVVLASNHAPLEFHRNFGPQVVSAFIKDVYALHILTGPDLRHKAMMKTEAFSYIGRN